MSLAQRLSVFEVPGERVVTLLSSGPLPVSQALVAALRDGADSGDEPRDLHGVPSMFEAARLVARQLRMAAAQGRRPGPMASPGGPVDTALILGGQIAGEPPRMFHIDAAGQVVEASERTRHLQLGPPGLAWPFIGQMLNPRSTLDDAAKMCLLSLDARMQRNRGVDEPIDLLRYAADSFSAEDLTTFEAADPYWQRLRAAHAQAMARLVSGVPAPPSKRSHPDPTRAH